MVDAREYLESFKRSEARIQLKAKQIQELQDRLLRLSVPPDKEFVTHTSHVSVMADTIALIIDMQKEIDQQASRLLIAKREAFHLLDQIKPESAALLMDRYLEGKTVSEISKAMFLSERHVLRKVNDAIAELQVILDSEKKMSANVT